MLNPHCLLCLVPSNPLIYGISRDGSKKFNIRICEHMILSQLRMGARQAKNAPLCHKEQISAFPEAIALYSPSQPIAGCHYFFFSLFSSPSTWRPHCPLSWTCFSFPDSQLEICIVYSILLFPISTIKRSRTVHQFCFENGFNLNLL